MTKTKAHLKTEALTETVYLPGQSYWGRNQYIEYMAGDLPIIISAPHGGYLEPPEIPDRSWGSRGIDYRSQEYAREVVAYIQQLTGHQPHLIINHLHRIKLDANRDLGEAAQGNIWAEQAWYEFHGFIEVAKTAVMEQCGRGQYFDFHTNDHAGQWTEVGYGVHPLILDLPDLELDLPKYRKRSDIRNLATTVDVPLSELLRGLNSLGGLLQLQGYQTIPSPAYPGPTGRDYYYTGFNTIRHGSRYKGTIDGIQIETYYQFVKDEDRSAYTQALAQAIVTYMEQNYRFNLQPAGEFLPLCNQTGGTSLSPPIGYPYTYHFPVIYVLK